MLKPEERFMPQGKGYFGPDENPKTRADCDVWDWDQLRMIKVKGTAKLLRPYEDDEIPILERFVDYLSPAIHSVTVNDDGLISEVSTDPKEDDTLFIGYLPFSTTESLHGCRTVQYSKLQELDRLGPGVDLSSYQDESQDVQMVAFKFNPIGKQHRMQMAWDELHLYTNLPQHPNIVPFDRVVLDDVKSQVIGFTTKYITGGTLANPKRPFLFEYLQQLTQLVDFLNLDLGIMHQAIAPRNLLVDPQTEKLLLFDFNRVAQGEKGLLEGRDDITGVVFTLYELITGDEQFTLIPRWDRKIGLVQDIPEWPCKRELDADVAVFRKFLNEWVAKRSASNDMDKYLNAPSRLTWPDLPRSPEYDVPFELGRYQDGKIHWATGPRSRRTAMELGQYVFRWERPPQSRLVRPERTHDSK
ncbi:hypothetical protein ONZ43_g3155 [Nemania bipapillata]|uniref:Uncharacterized protein n=1 Tax=Nemania bipapillata TaxID=110536 RepID=A0ACC2IY90_9PEZI|nr:hypothetical protein ONZ43_g3155 [Nemania bipapillata]